jgi:hypothetical protein
VSDPKRILDGGGPKELGELLVAAQKDVLDDEAAERVRAGVMATLPIGAIGAAGALGKTTGATTASRPLVAALVAGALAVGAYVYVSSNSSHPVAAPPASAIRSSASSAPQSPLAAPSQAHVEPTSAQPIAPSANVPVVPSPAPMPLPASAPAPVVPGASSAPSAPSPREGLLLLQARQALDHDPARALALVRQHEQEFPNSQLAPERAKLLKEALARKSD